MNKDEIKDVQKKNKKEFSQINYEKIRYDSKKSVSFLAVLFTITFFIIAPSFYSYLYESFIYRKTNNDGLFFFAIIFLYDKVLHYSFLIIYWLIYRSKSNFFEQFKVNDHPWPWDKDINEWYKTLQSWIKIHFLNKYLIIVLVNIPQIFKKESLVDLSSDRRPSIIEVICHVFLFVIVEDFCFYWLHRIWHIQSIYAYIHKVHHRFIDTVCLANNYEHPIEHIGNIFAASVPLLFMGKRIHIVTYLIWILIRTGEAYDKHAGYEFPWSPFSIVPLSGSGEFHTYHHTNTKGNYGSFFIFWDWMGNTYNKHYLLAYEEKLAKKDK